MDEEEVAGGGSGKGESRSWCGRFLGQALAARKITESVVTLRLRFLVLGVRLMVVVCWVPVVLRLLLRWVGEESVQFACK